MANLKLPSEVRRFLLATIPSVPHLEALLLIRERSGSWTPAELGARLYLDPTRAAALIDHLADAGLLECREGACRYAPRNLDAERLVDVLAALYAKHTVAIAQKIHANSDSNAQRFADAFLLHKDP